MTAHRDPAGATATDAGSAEWPLLPYVDFSREVYCILGLPFDAVTLEQATVRVRDAAARRTPFLLSTANLNFVVAARSDPTFRDSVIHSQLCVADGMPIVWVARLLGLPVRARVSGAGLFERLLVATSSPPLRLFFFGGPPGVAELACQRINGESGGLHCVGFESPGFVAIDAMSGDASLERIRCARPEFLLVSLGAKKGQAWIERNRGRLGVPVVSHLGAVVNFAAGSVQRAPVWMQMTGLEWLWRIGQEPSLWRRYAADAWTFASLFTSGVLPLAWQRWTQRCPPHREPGVALSRQGGAVTIALSGTLYAAGLGALRHAFTDATTSSARIELDLSGVKGIDAAAIGLLMLLHGHQRDAAQALVLCGESTALRRQFQRHQAEFLLDGSL